MKCLIAFCIVISSVELQAIPCQSPSENCDCFSTGNVLCTRMRDIPSNLPSSTILLDLDSNNVGPILKKHTMDRLGNMALEQLYLSGAGLESIEFYSFALQSELRLLDLSRNELEELDNLMFYGLSNLTTLLLTECSLRVIEPFLFVNTPELEYLDLRKNGITSLGISSIPKLQVLLISLNEIRNFDGDTFARQRNLRRLEMDGNKLEIPRARWFQHLVENNGTLKLEREGNRANPWKCCSSVVQYLDFVTNVSSSYEEADHLNIKCFSPPEYKGKRVRDIAKEELLLAPCSPPTTAPIPKNVPSRSEFPQFAPLNDATHSPMYTSSSNSNNEVSGLNFKAKANVEREERKSGNFMQNLTNIDVALILLSVGALTSMITAFVAVKVNKRKKKKAFGNFMANLPQSKDTGGEDFPTQTTRTYRQDVPVYGSTGQVVDRNRVKPTGNYNESFSDDSLSSAGSGRNISTPKRKPPPYEPPPISPDGDLASDYQFNNSSSVNLISLGILRPRSGAILSSELDSDFSDNDLWDISTVR